MLKAKSKSKKVADMVKRLHLSARNMPTGHSRELCEYVGDVELRSTKRIYEASGLYRFYERELWHLQHPEAEDRLAKKLSEKDRKIAVRYLEVRSFINYHPVGRKN